MISWYCEDCGDSMHFVYMIVDEIWHAAKLGKNHNVCPWCLMKRLGRELTPKDFTSAPCNDLVHWASLDEFYDFLRWSNEDWKRRKEQDAGALRQANVERLDSR